MSPKKIWSLFKPVAVSPCHKIEVQKQAPLDNIISKREVIKHFFCKNLQTSKDMYEGVLNLHTAWLAKLGCQGAIIENREKLKCDFYSIYFKLRASIFSS